MTNPVLDQERADYLTARQATSTRRGLLAAWPRPDKELPIVDLDIDWVRLSTLNHRTKAEQMREREKSGREDMFTADPLGPAAQIAQLTILKSQTGFEDLKDDLKERGQQEPAVVTAEGVLINGNRRSAALRSLYRDDNHVPSRYVRCLVLPSDATVDELVDLETELQIARDFRENYSWVNEALLIEELFNRENKDWSRVAMRMHREPSRVRALFEKLQQLHQLIALSDGTRHHADFDDNESAFDELARHIRNKSKSEANAVRGTYFLGTLTNVNYRDLRHLRRPDAAAIVRRELEAEPSIAALLDTVRENTSDAPDSILDAVLGGEGSQDDELLDVLSFFARHRPDAVVALSNGKEAVVADLAASVGAAITAASQEAQEETRDVAALVAPINRLSSALENIERASSALERARSFDEWDERTFQLKVEELKSAIERLETAE